MSKINKILQNKLIKNYIILLISLMIIEMIFRFISVLPFNDWAFLRIFLGINIIALFISSILYCFKKTVEKILMLLIVFIFSFYSLIQIGFNNYLGLYISFGNSSQAGAVKDYLFDYIESFEVRYYFLLLPFILLVLYYIFIDKNNIKDMYELKIERKNGMLKRTVVLIILVILCGLYYTTLSLKFMQNELQVRSNKSLFNYPSLTNIVVNQFGINMYLIIDIKSMFVSHEEMGVEGNKYAYKKEIVTDYTRSIDDSIWNEVIKNEQNRIYKKLNNYYINKEITPKNDYTGYFEGKNLIFIMMESVNNIFLDETYFPTFHKLYTEGWHWENSYSPRNSCSTGNNEMSGMVSLFSVNSSCTANKYRKNTYFESIFNLFNNTGYSTSSYHNYISAYYYRQTIHTNMDSNIFYDAKALGIPYKSIYEEWPSDVDLMEKSFDKYINQDKFMVWMTTVTSHQPYSVSSEYGNKHLDLFEGTEYSKPLKRYMSKLKELDLGLELLLNKLEESGKLNDTVIILFSDHYPYGINTKILKEYNFGYDLELNNEKDRTPFVIYNPNLENKTFEEYTTIINLLPTISNLFNLNYDPRYYAGSDLFSNNYENIVIFADGSWQSSIAFYNARTGKISYNSDKTYTSEEIIKINQNINDRITMSNLSITSNYFNYLESSLDKYKKIVNAVPEQ